MITCWHCEATLLDGTLFCDACGATLLEGAPRRITPPLAGDEGYAAGAGGGTPRLVLPAIGQSIPLPPRPELVIGRGGEPGPAPDVDLAPFRAVEAGVSRAHAVIDLAGPAPQIEDLDSTNGTYVNGRRIPPGRRVPVRQGDEIHLGQLAIRLEL
ncbi:MAG: FHA domain-containing protein [Chloroflexales bacterium]|nr:FHA domain-containing protein [Chloroflexales bacterium]